MNCMRNLPNALLARRNWNSVAMWLETDMYGLQHPRFEPSWTGLPLGMYMKYASSSDWPRITVVMSPALPKSLPPCPTYWWKQMWSSGRRNFAQFDGPQEHNMHLTP